MIKRTLQKVLEQYMGKGKAILLIGARQVGKSTLFRMLTEAIVEDALLWLNCDLQNVSDTLTNPTLQLLFGYKNVVVIDEAQRVTNVGMTLKLIVDNFPHVQLLVTGPSALDLHNRLNEPLTGRKVEYHLYPISTGELYASKGLLGVNELFEQRMVLVLSVLVPSRHRSVIFMKSVRKALSSRVWCIRPTRSC